MTAAWQQEFATREHSVQTVSGRLVDLIDPDPASIAIDDIAHSLSMQCRYNGHIRHFYSVAQHSVLVAAVCPPEHAMWGLLHDAAEAYTGDIVRPVRAQLGGVDELEQRLLRAVALHFALPWPVPPVVFEADDWALSCEEEIRHWRPVWRWRGHAVRRSL